MVCLKFFNLFVHLLVSKIKAEVYLTEHKMIDSDQTANSHDIIEASDGTDVMEAVRALQVCHLI